MGYWFSLARLRAMAAGVVAHGKKHKNPLGYSASRLCCVVAHHLCFFFLRLSTYKNCPPMCFSQIVVCRIMDSINLHFFFLQKIS
jgi:hypothetical protein